ncbi:hypothetical protein SCUP515_05385 [Seiridium cupressi]
MVRAASGDRGPARPPLRTYGKRSISSESADPPAKKRRIGAPEVDIHSIAGRFTQKVGAQPADIPLPQSLPPLPTQQPNRGTILSYFKVRSPSSGTTTPCAQSSEPLAPSSTPPSSPPASETARKKRRRLTTKPPLRTNMAEGDEADETNVDNTQGPDESPPKRSQQDGPVLQIASTNTLNQKHRMEIYKSDAEKQGGAKKQKPNKKATVQTTLSLSLTEKQFVECTECNMLYNPYHEKDAKMHKKRHATVLKSKKALDDDGLHVKSKETRDL